MALDSFCEPNWGTRTIAWSTSVKIIVGEQEGAEDPLSLVAHKPVIPVLDNLDNLDIFWPLKADFIIKVIKYIVIRGNKYCKEIKIIQLYKTGPTTFVK